MLEDEVAAVDGAGAVAAREGEGVGQGEVAAHVEQGAGDVDEGDEQEQAVAAEEEGQEELAQLLQQQRRRGRVPRVVRLARPRGPVLGLGLAARHGRARHASALAQARGMGGRHGRRGRGDVRHDMTVPVVQRSGRAAERVHVVLAGLHPRSPPPSPSPLEISFATFRLIPKRRSPREKKKKPNSTRTQPNSNRSHFQKCNLQAPRMRTVSSQCEHGIQNALPSTSMFSILRQSQSSAAERTIFSLKSYR
jgi:pyruvate/2-oxoglutarate dehydrogenase complex dihydrolipoamide acyltransferase (E2) component